MTDSKTDPLFCLGEVHIRGFWRRIRFSARVLFRGKAEISFDALDFLKDMARHIESNTTCMLTAPKEESDAQDFEVVDGRYEIQNSD